MKHGLLSALWLIVVASACGGTQAPPTAAPAPAPSAAPPAVQYKSAFDKGSTEGWTSILGNWWVKDGTYQQDDDRLQGAKAMLELADSDCYTLAFKARKSRPGSGGFMAIVKYQKQYVWWELGGRDTNVSGVVGINNLNETTRQFLVEHMVWYRVKVIVNGERLVGWLDDAQKWSIRRAPAEVTGLNAQELALGKGLVGLAGLGTWTAHMEFTDVEVQPTCPQ